MLTVHVGSDCDISDRSGDDAPAALNSRVEASMQMAREALAAMQVDEQRRTCDIGAARGPIALA